MALAGPILVGRAIYEPGWRSSEHVRPTAGTELCQVAHVGVVVSGSAAVLMSDGTEPGYTEAVAWFCPAQEEE